jgi:hypothetical protein
MLFSLFLISRRRFMVFNGWFYMRVQPHLFVFLDSFFCFAFFND